MLEQHRTRSGPLAPHAQLQNVVHVGRVQLHHALQGCVRLQHWRYAQQGQEPVVQRGALGLLQVPHAHKLHPLCEKGRQLQALAVPPVHALHCGCGPLNFHLLQLPLACLEGLLDCVLAGFLLLSLPVLLDRFTQEGDAHQGGGIGGRRRAVLHTVAAVAPVLGELAASLCPQHLRPLRRQGPALLAHGAGALHHVEAHAALPVHDHEAGVAVAVLAGNAVPHAQLELALDALLNQQVLVLLAVTRAVCHGVVHRAEGLVALSAEAGGGSGIAGAAGHDKALLLYGHARRHTAVVGPQQRGLAPEGAVGAGVGPVLGLCFSVDELSVHALRQTDYALASQEAAHHALHFAGSCRLPRAHLALLERHQLQGDGAHGVAVAVEGLDGRGAVLDRLPREGDGRGAAAVQKGAGAFVVFSGAQVLLSEANHQSSLPLQTAV
mmetsp:Transcript_20672/g.45980  ORF Transcript_20672/g.45980 Transcript_20672/m.45980 type:complete len:437 (-) Transcript_20672:84-1394(-)